MAESGRVFPPGMTSEHYSLKEFRAAQLAAPRVRDDSVAGYDAADARAAVKTEADDTEAVRA